MGARQAVRSNNAFQPDGRRAARSACGRGPECKKMEHRLKLPLPVALDFD
jgi:hypothetical protein